MLSIILSTYIMYASDRIYSISHYEEDVVHIHISDTRHQTGSVLYRQSTCTPIEEKSIFFSSKEEEDRFCESINKLQKRKKTGWW